MLSHAAGEHAAAGNHSLGLFSPAKHIEVLTHLAAVRLEEQITAEALEALEHRLERAKAVCLDLTLEHVRRHV